MRAENFNEQNLEYALRHRLFVGNFEEWKESSLRNYLSDRKLSVKILNDGIVLPPIHANTKQSLYFGGIYDRNLNFVDGNLASRTDPNMICETVRGAYLPKVLQRIDEEVIYGGIMLGHFGAFILQCLTRFWYMIQNPNDKRRIILLHIAFGFPDWAKSFFELLGIDISRIIIIQQPSMFKKIVVPEQAYFRLGDYTNEQMSVYNFIMRKSPPPVEDQPIKKIYLSRGKLPPGSLGVYLMRSISRTSFPAKVMK